MPKKRAKDLAAKDLKPGLRFRYRGADIEILRDRENGQDRLAQPLDRWWSRDLSTGAEGYVSLGPNGKFYNAVLLAAVTTPAARHHATKKKSAAQLEREIDEALKTSAPSAGRYMLVDNRTGKDMRVAHDFEVAQIQSRRHGVSMLELGGGWNTPVKIYEVRLRDTKVPKVKTDPVPGLPGTTVKSRLFYFGELAGGKLYIDERSYRTLESALADVKPRGWRRHNSVIVEQQQLARDGVNHGSRSVLHSIIDGQILDDRFLPS